MANLDELKKRLYKEEENFNERMKAPELGSVTSKNKNINIAKASWQEIDAPKNKTGKFFFWGFLMAVGIMLSLILFFWLGGGKFFESSELKIEIVGASTIGSGERTTWQVQVSNKSKTVLENAVLVFNFPEGASNIDAGKTLAGRTRREIGKINSGEVVQEVFDAYVFGGRDSERNVSAVIEYRPEGSSATFAKDASFSFKIVRSPIALSIDIPKELRIGQEVEFRVNYVSQSEADIYALTLRMNYPEGFTFISSSPLPSDKTSNSLWEIGNLKSKSDGTLIIRGVLKGGNLEPKNFKAEIGTYNSDSKSMLAYDEVVAALEVRSPFLQVTLRANGSNTSEYIASPGETVRFSVLWKNNLPELVKNAALEVKFSGIDLIDERNIDIENGSFKEATKSVIWNASTYRDFRTVLPSASGEINFAIKIKDSIPLNPESARPLLKVNATLKPGENVPNFENVDVGGAGFFDIKISSNLQLASKILYFNAPIENFGPIPPEVGEPTTYTVIWSLANTSNDLGNVSVKSTLPPYVDYKNIVRSADANFIYDRNTNSIEWKIPKLLAGTGFSRPALTLAFQISITPSQSQIGSSPVLINKTEVSGRDLYTNKILTSSVSDLTTSLPEDPKITSQQKIIAP